MTRRGFLGAIAGALTAAAVDPDLTLWTPGRKLISVPRAPLVARSANVFITPEWLARETLIHLRENLVIAREMNRVYSGQFDVLMRAPYHVMALRGSR